VRRLLSEVPTGRCRVARQATRCPTGQASEHSRDGSRVEASTATIRPANARWLTRAIPIDRPGPANDPQPPVAARSW
jgi:hypothetical protein